MKKNAKLSAQELQSADIIFLLRYSLALQLFQSGVPQLQIAKRLKVSNNTVSGMLKGIAPQVKAR